MIVALVIVLAVPVWIGLACIVHRLSFGEWNHQATGRNHV